MNILKTIRKFSRIIFVFLLSLNLISGNLPLGILDYLADIWRDRKVVDALYLAGRNKNVIDNFVPTAYANPGTRVRTVEFFAGQDEGSATNDNQNQQQNLASQTFQLAENSADIIDAYVEVSAQIGATTSTTYASGHIFFDACVPACTPSPAAFTTTAGLGTSSLESQSIRFRAPVTSETEIAAYTGGAANRTFQVGYCFGTGSTCSGTTAANIQGANAKLVLTYTYDDTSATQTNTVIYPLESAAETGSKTAVQAACTIDSNCPTFSYNANIPEVSSQLSQFFFLQTSINAATADWQTNSDIGGNPGGANTALVYFDEALSANGGWVNVLRSSVAGYANNSAQSLEISTNATGAYVLGGENYVTYTYSNAAATKTRTVVYPVGEVCTTGCTTKSALTGPTVYFPESGVSIKKAWFRAHTSKGGTTTAGTLAISTKVGNNTETGQTSYSFATDTQGVTDDGYFNHLIPSSDYTELGSATGSSGKAVQMTAQWTLNAGGAVSGELVITYQYTGESSGYLVTQNLFAGQQTAAPATTYTTATGAINPSLPETTGTKTVRGASIKMSAKDTSSTAGGAGGANLSTSTCTSSDTSTPTTDSEITRLMLWKDVSSIVTNSDAQTYTACYSRAQTSLFTGILIITYQWDAPLGTSFTLNAYRWYVDSDAEDVSNAWGNPDIAQNTAISIVPVTDDPPNSSQELRLRVNFTVNNSVLGASAKRFKLQFKAGTDATCTTGSWTDVASGATWEYAASTVIDGTDLTVSRLSPVSDVLEEYIKSKPTGLNPNGATVGQEIEYDFHIIGTNISEATQYSFRAVETDAGGTTSTVFDGYTNCPTLTTEPGTTNLLRHGNVFASEQEKGFFWAD